MKSVLLTADESALWHAWKLAGERVLSRVARDLSDAMSMSGPDYGVLSRLEELGNGSLRQQDLADSMRWDKSRLSHQLTRMERRRLVVRRPAGTKGVVVELTAAGAKTLREARPVHAASIRKHLIARIGARERPQLLAALRSIADDAA